MLDNKEQKKNRRSKNKGILKNTSIKNPKDSPIATAIGIIIAVVIMIFINMATSGVKDKTLIIEEPNKVTYTKDFEKLVKQGSIKSVYIDSDTPVLLFTVKEGTKVKSVDYETTKSASLEKLIKQSEQYQKKGYKNDNYIVTHRSFNPDTDAFKELLYSNNIQVFKIPSPNTAVTRDIIRTIMPTLMYLLLFKILFFPSKREIVKSTTIPDVKFSDIAGNEEVKEELMFFVDFLKNPEEFKKMGAQIPKGFLLNGPPGNGKTMLAKAIAGEAGVPFFDKSGTDFLDKYVGVGPQRIKNLFDKARSKAPCIIFIDEIDSIGSARGSSSMKEYDNMLNQLLVELDGFNSSEGVIIIGATNRIDTLDPALIRPGRFDRHVTINLPSKTERKDLLDLAFKDKPVSSDVDIESLAGLLYGFSGASIKSLINDAALVATRKKNSEITKEDIDEAFVKMVLGANPRKKVEDNSKNAKILAYHEAGHALATTLWTDNIVNRVTIIGTTGNVGGFTSSTPSEELMLSRRDFYNKIRILYGGRVAEYLYFNEDYDKVTSGASNDLKVVSQYLDSIIKELGMNENMLFAMSSSEANSEDVLEYKNKLALQLYNETLESLRLNRESLDAIVDVLLEKESLNTKEYNEIIESQTINYSYAMKKAWNME